VVLAADYASDKNAF